MSTKQENNSLSENEKIDLVALVVHKLKTPISSIKLCLEMLLEGDFGELSDEQKKVLERTYQRNNLLISFVNDLLNLAKVKGKKFTYTMIPVNVGDLIHGILQYEAEEIEKRHVTVTIEKSKGRFPKVKLDKEKILLALQNIIDNAIRYSHVGGEVIVRVAVASKQLNVEVQDFGIGVPETEKQSLFTEFFRGSNAKEVESMGSGLGLFIAKNIVEEHGGSIKFDSQQNKGTTFFVSLPVG